MHKTTVDELSYRLRRAKAINNLRRASQGERQQYDKNTYSSSPQNALDYFDHFLLLDLGVRSRETLVSEEDASCTLFDLCTFPLDMVRKRFQADAPIA
jgi:hypothetical protein